MLSVFLHTLPDNVCSNERWTALLSPGPLQYDRGVSRCENVTMEGVGPGPPQAHNTIGLNNYRPRVQVNRGEDVRLACVLSSLSFSLRSLVSR